MAVRGSVLALAALTASALASCGGSGTVHISERGTGGAQSGACAALVRSLPDDLVEGQHRRVVTPDSPYTAAFGNPAVTVRCGLPVPDHDPAAAVQDINGVDWLQLPGKHGALVYVSYRSAIVVEVVVPAHYRPADVLLGVPASSISAGQSPA